MSLPVTGLVGRCSNCYAVRDLDELLEVTSTRTGTTWHVCRPTVNNGQCFRRRVLSAAEHRIRTPTEIDQ